MNDKQIMRFGYEDTDKKIEIDLYGLIFEIKDLNNLDSLKELNEDDKEVIDRKLEEILGEGAINKINEKRLKDGYKELDMKIKINILGCIFETYAKGLTNGMFNKVDKTIDDLNENMAKYANMSREQRRNRETKNYRNYRGYRGYRRY